MNYISAKMISTKWGVSTRRVQQYCMESKIEGAYKLGNTWLIPENSQSPMSLTPSPSFYPYINFLDSFSFYPGQADSVLETLQGEERLLAECEFAYLRGELGMAKTLYLQSDPQSKTRICIMNMAAVEAIATSDYVLFRRIQQEFKDMIEADLYDEITNAVLQISSYNFLASIRADISEIDIMSMPVLPQKTIERGILCNCYYMESGENYERMIGCLKTVLSFHDKKKYSPADIYILLTCGLAYYKLGHVTEAKYYINNAINRALDDGFLMPFADYVSSLGKVLEDCLKDKPPYVYDKIVNIHEKSWINWLVLHNHYSKFQITTALTRQEYLISSLVVNGYTNQEIAQQFQCSLSTIQKKLINIFGKLMIEKRTELKKYIIWKP